MAGPGRNLVDILKNVRTLVAKNFKALDCVFSSTSVQNGPGANELCVEGLQEAMFASVGGEPYSKETLIAWMRLKTREAELLNLVGENAAALDLYESLHCVEALIENHFGGVGPFVLIGRPARAEIRALLQSKKFRHHGRGNGSEKYARLESWVEGLISANTSRLARFGGAEQAANLIKKALFEAHRRDANTAAAKELARRARNAVDKDQASLSMHIQVLSGQVYVHLLALEAEAKRGARPLDRDTFKTLLSDVDLLDRLSDSLKLQMYQLQAYYYRAVLLWHMSRVPESRGNSGAIRENLIKARDMMIALGNVQFEEEIEKIFNSIDEWEESRL